VTDSTKNSFKTSAEGIDLIKKQEGLRLDAYQNVINGVVDKVTIGYGHTGMLNGRPLALNDRITEQEAEQLLKEDLASFETAVNEAVTAGINQNQFDALMSFVYNVGPYAFKSSTLLKMLNNEDFEGAKNQFHRWDKIGGGVVCAGLTKRRAEEAELFGKPMAEEQPDDNPAPAAQADAPPPDLIPEDAVAADNSTFAAQVYNDAPTRPAAPEESAVEAKSTDNFVNRLITSFFKWLYSLLQNKTM